MVFGPLGSGPRLHTNAEEQLHLEDGRPRPLDPKPLNPFPPPRRLNLQTPNP